jgi:plasmid stability protein
MHTGGVGMALLQVRSFPDELYRELSRRSQAENRSIAQQTIVLLREALGAQNERKLCRQRMLHELLEDETVYSAELTPAADLIREDRDR